MSDLAPDTTRTEHEPSPSGRTATERPAPSPTLRLRDVTVRHVAAETDRVVATAVSLRNDAVLAPSLCEGWSRGHVLSHLARNAEALSRVVDAALDGTGGTMYRSDEQRDAEIDAGARRCAADLADDVRRTADDLAVRLRRLDELGPDRQGMTVPRTPGGPDVPVDLVPFLRLRELVLHHVDLQAGFGFEHVPPDLAALLLDSTVRRLRETDDPPPYGIRTTEGDDHVVGDGSLEVRGSRAGVLLWLTRGRPDGIRSDAALPAPPTGV